VGGGEDYELCFTAAREAERGLVALVGEATGTRVTCIGEVLPGDGGHWIELANGAEVPIRGGGWDDFEGSQGAPTERD
jgi:thiamine monophosphate kinase